MKRGIAWSGVPIPCIRCQEIILPSDKVELYGNGEPAHRECYLRPVIGSVAHIEQRCSCFVPGSDCGDDAALTRRQAAQASVRAWERKYLWEKDEAESDG